MRFGFLTVCAIALLAPMAASAQTIGDTTSGGAPFTISISPQYPAPGSQATLSFLSSTLNLANATVSVSVGGKQIYTGSARPVVIPLGKTGSVSSVDVDVSSAGGQYRQSVVIQPQDVSLITEPVASAPMLYPGKPLVPLNGDVRIVAVASLKDAGGKTLDPATLSYSWTVDGLHIADSSGIGKEAIMVASPLQYRERSISVVVESPAGNLTGGDTVSLTAADPSVRVYATDPLLGILYDHALTGTYAIAGTEAGLYAAPFSFPLTGGGPAVQWFLNGSPAQSGGTITLRPTGSGQGSASLTLTATSGTSAEATANLSLSFGTAQSTSFFGL
ncbi:MAG TPA: hypothetical protein VMV62_01875 [Candidatus Paceibacterota bacterium]|nr:hypothetical protein [Candidatus Paceibacterota bacterium]